LLFSLSLSLNLSPTSPIAHISPLFFKKKGREEGESASRKVVVSSMKWYIHMRELFELLFHPTASAAVVAIKNGGIVNIVDIAVAVVVAIGVAATPLDISRE
jgi:hypothetical protein